MIRLIAIAALVFFAPTSAQAITPAPITQPDSIAQVRYGCGPGRTRVGHVCVPKPTMRHYGGRAHRRG
jgi:hypothetical protein